MSMPASMLVPSMLASMLACKKAREHACELFQKNEHVHSFQNAREHARELFLFLAQLKREKPMLWKKISEDIGTDSRDYTIHYDSSI